MCSLQIRCIFLQFFYILFHFRRAVRSGYPVQVEHRIGIPAADADRILVFPAAACVLYIQCAALFHIGAGKFRHCNLISSDLQTCDSCQAV